MALTVLKKTRLEKGMPQIELAARTGITQGYLSAIETGIYTCSDDTLKRLAKNLQFKVAKRANLLRKLGTSKDWRYIRV